MLIHTNALCIGPQRQTRVLSVLNEIKVKVIREVNNILQPIPNSLDTVKMVNAIPQITQAVNIKGHTITFEVDTGAGDNFCSTHIWNQLGQPSLSAAKSRYESATGDSLPVTGTFTVTAKLPNQLSDSEATLQFTVVQNDTLDILGRNAILKLRD